MWLDEMYFGHHHRVLYHVPSESNFWVTIGITFISHYILFHPLVPSLPLDHIEHLFTFLQLRQIDVQNLETPIRVRLADT